MSYPEVSFECGDGQLISSINFASFGAPPGQCGNFQRGLRHAPKPQTWYESLDVLLNGESLYHALQKVDKCQVDKKLEIAKRKLQERYQEAQNAKKQRTVRP